MLSSSREKSVITYWRFALLALAVATLYAPVLGRLVLQWYQNPDYSHGFFVPPLVGYLIWRKRDAWAHTLHQPSWYGLVIVGVALGLLYLGSLGAELFLTRVSLWLTIIGLIVCFEGRARLRVLAFPLGFLLFMIPVPAIIYNQIVFPLQLLASNCASHSLHTINLFPVLREGNVLVLPNYTLEVVDACSGIRSLMALLTLASVYSYLVERTVWLRIVLVVAMVPLAIVANAGRVMLAALCTQLMGVKAAESLLHLLSGLVVFLIATLLLLALHAFIFAVRRRLERAIP